MLPLFPSIFGGKILKYLKSAELLTDHTFDPFHICAPLNLYIIYRYFTPQEAVIYFYFAILV